MLLSAVIIVLREVIEAALLFSIFLFLGNELKLKQTWFFGALVLGLMGAISYGLNIGWVSDWFEGVGQEVTNALIQFFIYFFVLIYIYLFIQAYYQNQNKWILVIMILAGGLIISREGAEILLYYFSVTRNESNRIPAIMGMIMGASIGLSVGFLFYYLLKMVKAFSSTIIAFILLILVSAGLVSQASMLLIQADWLPAQLPLWNTSAWLSEKSVMGQLVYALLGYESTPTLIQLIFYLSALIIPSTLSLFLYFKYSPSS